MKTRIFLILIVIGLIFFSLSGSVGRDLGLQISGSAKTLDSRQQSPTNTQVITTTAGELWQDVNAKSLRDAELREQYGPKAYRSLRLNTEALKSILRRAPREHASGSDTAILSLPLPDGGSMRFKIHDSPIMEEELANRYPQIKTYRGQAIDDPGVTARFDWTQFGFHAIVLSTKGTILIEPASAGNTSDYIAYFQGDNPAGEMSCQADGEPEHTALTGIIHHPKPWGIRPSVVSGSQLRTYRLAVAATAEYTQTYGSGTVAGGLAAITTTINLVNAIYEKEVAVRLVLIANNDQIVFTNTATDGYTHDNVVALINENPGRLDAIIGNANFDVGHVFDGRLLGGGAFSFQGQASIASVCQNNKARGVSITRSVQPSHVIAYYSNAHELGHQFGASHTFNATSGACLAQRSSITAYEPGTGSTIMGYRFTCAPEDFMSSDTYFHIASLDQITAFTSVGSGSSCPVTTATGNNIPTLDAGASFTIPSQTPFTLTATAGDVDGDTLTYCWEQFDLGNPSPPSTDDGTRPIFRSFAPTIDPSRTFPRLSDVLSGIPTFGESLPTTTRTMNFRVTVRDNRNNGGAANSDGMQLNVRADAGPFTVTQPLNGTAWNTSSTQTVSWNVANTNAAPVSCANVKITLSLDGGITFPIVLANSTPNDGSENVTVPGTPSGFARVKVEGVGNVFFNISQGFAINGAANSTPTITDFSPNTGGTGTMVTINGTNFISPSFVRFNGVNATFTVNSTTQIVASVPAGATNGPISVVTSSGTAVSATNFLTSPSFIVTGRIADGGNNPIAGATVTFSMNFQGTMTTRTATTDSSGNYSSGDVGCQNGVLVTPSKVGFSFSPIARSFVSGNCLSGTSTADFTGTLAGPNSIQFSSSNYEVTEGTLGATITLNRTGDTSGSATVAYQTMDTDNFTVGCAEKVANLGGAFARCDFATSLDTVTFGAGETSKAFSVPIIDDAWDETAETFTIVLSSPAGATLGGQTSAIVTINDNETVDGPNPIFNSPFFVRVHYLDFLSREPDTAGFNAWVNLLNNCPDINNDPNCDRITVSKSFFGSLEFQLKGYYAFRFYKLAFDRLPLYTEIVADMRAVTGQTPEEVFQKKAAFANAFVQRAEFMNRYDALSNAFYVSELMSRYQLTQITTPDPTNPDGPIEVTLTNFDLVDRLNGVGGTMTRAQVLRAIADSDEVFLREFNSAFVAMQYYGYLRRTPEPAGYNMWLNILNANPTDQRTMVNGFMNSPEYRLRFGPSQ